MTGNVVCIGTFDGVHLGHRAMIDRAREVAAGLGNGGGTAPVVALSFWPHPRAVLTDSGPKLLCTLEQRTTRLRDAGAADVRIARFTRELSRLTPEEFVQSWLVDELSASAVVVGENFRFGVRASGTPETLRELGETHGFSVSVVPLLTDGGEAVSSSIIRRLLGESGQVGAAAELLGRNYTVDGTVVIGERRGRELGVPTANLEWDHGLVVPREGVYSGRVHLSDGRSFPAAISVGTKPQFGGAEMQIESHLIGYEGDEFYNTSISVEFAHWLRPQGAFESVDALIEQMQRDIEECLIQVGEPTI